MPQPTNRRDFVKSAALTGAAFLSAAALPEPPLAPPHAQLDNLPVPKPEPRKIGYAIVGLGQLALEQILPAFSRAHISQPVALVSGHLDKALQVAEAYQVRPEAIYNYENYDKMAEDPRIEAVYVVLPNSMHAEFTIRALKAGKHVLCEKPMAANPAECEQMIAAAQQAQRKLMVAYRLMFEPMTNTAKALLEQGAFGKMKTFASSNCQTTNAPNIRLSAKLAGGPLGDIGIYSINTARFLLGEDPVEVTATAHQPADDPRFREVPESAVFTLRFPSGVLASCDCSFSSTESRRWRAHCTQGYLEMDPAFSYHGLRLRTKDGGSDQGDTRVSELVQPEKNQFALEMDHFSECLIQNKEPRATGHIGLVDMKIIAALQESIKTGRTVKVG